MKEDSTRRTATSVQYSTFLVAGRLYGIDVTKVQEVVRPMTMTKIPLAPSYVCGLINLRGQVATAIGLRQLFGISQDQPKEQMNVVCKCDGSLIALLVDEIGDVVEVPQKDYEPTPNTVPESVRRFMSGVFKTPSAILSVVDIDQLSSYLNKQTGTSESKPGASQS